MGTWAIHISVSLSKPEMQSLRGFPCRPLAFAKCAAIWHQGTGSQDAAIGQWWTLVDGEVPTLAVMEKSIVAAAKKTGKGGRSA